MYAEIISNLLLRHQPVQIRRWLPASVPELKSRGFTTLAVMNPYMHPSEGVQAILDPFDRETAISEKNSDKFPRIRKVHAQTPRH
jgi:hypothetical protein